MKSVLNRDRRSRSSGNTRCIPANSDVLKYLTTSHTFEFFFQDAISTSDSKRVWTSEEEGYYLSTSSFNRLYSLEIRSSTDCRSRRISRFLYWTSWMSFSFSKIISFLCVSSFFNRSISFCSCSERPWASRLSRSVCSLERWVRARSSPATPALTSALWSYWFYLCIWLWRWRHSATSILIEHWFPTRTKRREQRVRTPRPWCTTKKS